MKISPNKKLQSLFRNVAASPKIHEKITRQYKSTLTQPSEKKDALEHETQETSTVPETDERKSNVLSCF